MFNDDPGVDQLIEIGSDIFQGTVVVDQNQLPIRIPLCQHRLYELVQQIGRRVINRYDNGKLRAIFHRSDFLLQVLRRARRDIGVSPDATGKRVMTDISAG